MMHNNGFTLIELIIAVAVIGILVAVAVPSYRQHTAASEVNACHKFLSASRLVVDNEIQLSGGDATAITVASLGGVGDCEDVVISDATDAGNIRIVGSVNALGGINVTHLRSGATGTWSCAASDPNLAPDTCT